MLIVVVLAATAWLVWGNRFPSASSGDVVPVGETGRRPGSGLAIADLGGVEDDYGFVRDFSDVQKLGFLESDEIAVFRDAQAGPARVSVNDDIPAGRAIVLVTQVKDRGAAKTAAQVLNELQISRGFVPNGPLVLEWLGDPNSRPLVRIHYQHNDLLVRMELVGRAGQDVANGFGPLLNRQLEVLPANG
ncbi:hypothetical protein [Actinocrispum wychmicini]|uniref:Uncharacterized protein n=1 Tax=Actinocrispum wychmicini TaxID=1213861 RepID=A0A4R2K455_9PSEU|nr:hypothetical protein [Actinocrispum wychmicini]TCO64579.1 hypothetical protein EV192_101356 [Actinocrispum wychmicini]